MEEIAPTITLMGNIGIDKLYILIFDISTISRRYIEDFFIKEYDTQKKWAWVCLNKRLYTFITA